MGETPSAAAVISQKKQLEQSGNRRIAANYEARIEMAGDHFADEFAEFAGYLHLSFSFCGEEQAKRPAILQQNNHIIVARNYVFVSWLFLLEHDYTSALETP
jgi:hypothetical protein